MAKASTPQGSGMSRAVALMVIAGLFLGFAVLAEAQDPAAPKPKVANIKPADPKKTEDPKPATPKPAEPAPSESTATTPGGSGFAAIEEATRLMNQYISKGWKDNSLQPAERCSDYDFIRRASLDIIGRIATVEEIERYIKDPPATRRGLLLERLLYGDQKEEYAKNWATLWAYSLLTRAGNLIYREQMRAWLEEAFGTETVDAQGKVVPKPHMNYKEFIEQLLTAKGRSNDNGAVNFILAHLGGPNPAPQQGRDGAFDVHPITARSVRLFLGYQIQCTQCHDHPFNADWKQKHYWGVNAFFRQVNRDGNVPAQANNRMQAPPVLVLRDDAGLNAKGIVFYEKRSGVFLPSDASFLDGNKIPPNSQLSRREDLARFFVGYKELDANRNVKKDASGKEYPAQFTRAFVNRMWGHFFGRGLNVKPAADDFGEHNELVHDELLNALAEQFSGTGSYDPRKLMKWICSSDAYNLKAVANKSNESQETEPYFSRMLLKMMTPEQLLESLIVSTQPSGTADPNANRQLRDRWMSVLVRNFGDDEGNEVSYNGTILQALLMMNGPDLNRAISSGSGTVQAALKKGATASGQAAGKRIMDHLFLATLNRPATTKEFQQIAAKMALKGAADTTDAVMQDVFWALLNCNEFLLNH